MAALQFWREWEVGPDEGKLGDVAKVDLPEDYSVGGRAPPVRNMPMPSGGPRSRTVGRGLTDLLAKCLSRIANLFHDRADGLPLRAVVGSVVLGHSSSAIAKFK